LCLRKNKRYSNNSSKSSKKSNAVLNCEEKSTDSPNSASNHKESKRISNGNNKEKSDKEGKKEKKVKVKEEKEKEKSRKVNSPTIVDIESNSELGACRTLLDEMEKHESCWPFLEPVNTKHFPTYKKIIKKPMDFTIIRYKFDSNQ